MEHQSANTQHVHRSRARDALTALGISAALLATAAAVQAGALDRACPGGGQASSSYCNPYLAPQP